MFFYYRKGMIPMPLSSKKEEIVNNYIDSNPDDMLKFEYNDINYILDLSTLIQEINEDCFHCGEFLVDGSCCVGPPFPFSPDMVKPYVKDLGDYIRPEFRKRLEKCTEDDISPIYSESRQSFYLLYDDKKRPTCFLRTKDRCGLHKYFLDNNLPFWEKPCADFPLDVIVDAKVEDKYDIENFDSKIKTIFIYLVSERTNDFYKWSRNKHMKLCLDKDLDKKVSDLKKFKVPVDRTKYFRYEDYKPAYEVLFKGYGRYEYCGIPIYKIISSYLKNGVIEF